MDAPRLIALLLRLAGSLMCLAFLAAVMPADWMVATHAQLGLGELPRLPIVDYLTRSLSARYGFHGLLLWFVARDVIRYRGLVTFIGITNIAFGLMMLAIDLHAGMPLMWTVSEGPPIAVFGVVLLSLNARVAGTRPS